MYITTALSRYPMAMLNTVTRISGLTGMPGKIFICLSVERVPSKTGQDIAS